MGGSGSICVWYWSGPRLSGLPSAKLVCLFTVSPGSPYAEVIRAHVKAVYGPMELTQPFQGYRPSLDSPPRF